MKIRHILVLLLTFIITNTYAYNLKDKSIQVIIPFGPGGGTDTVFRKIEKFGVKSNINFRPSYKPGANGLIGIKALYEESNDGSIIGIITFDSLTTYAMKNPIDLNNVITIQKNIFGVVSNKNKSLIDMMKGVTEEKPLRIGYLLYSQKAIMETAFKAYGINQEQIYVPYKAGPDLIQNVINGDLDLGITSLNVLAPLIESGKIKLLAVDSNTTVSTFPEAFLLKKLDSTIPDINKGSSIVLPPSTNPQIKIYWSKFIQDYLNDPDTKLDSKQNYWEPVRKNIKELEKDLIENDKILRAVK